MGARSGGGGGVGFGGGGGGAGRGRRAERRAGAGGGGGGERAAPARLRDRDGRGGLGGRRVQGDVVAGVGACRRVCAGRSGAVRVAGPGGPADAGARGRAGQRGAAGRGGGGAGGRGPGAVANVWGFGPGLVFPTLPVPKSPWGWSDVAGVRDVAEEINRCFTALSRILELSGNPIAVLSGVVDSQDIAVEPGGLWGMPGGTEGDVLDLLSGGGGEGP